jgi:uncharacterized membrane protein (DUF2068 family)
VSSGPGGVGPRERGLIVITAYKLVKGGTWLVLATVLAASMRMGLEDRLLGLADHLRHHAHAWSLEFAKLVVRAASPRGLWTIIVALVADGIVSLIEGWALWRGHWWGPWLVVVATGSLLPFEVVALVRDPHAIRLSLLGVNAAIALYLLRQAMREHRHRASG